MRNAALAALLAAFAAAPSLADRVVFHNGRVIEGIVLSHSDQQVRLEIGAGTLELPASLVARVEIASSALDAYRAQASGLAQDDVAGWLALAEWARAEGLETRAREAYLHVVALSPENAVAQRALGRVQHGDQWLSPEARYRALGYLYDEGRWVPPEIALAAEELRLRRVEAELRLRESEARVRAAEAARRRAEQQASETVATGGLVTPWLTGPVVAPWWAWPGAGVAQWDGAGRRDGGRRTPGRGAAADGAGANGKGQRAAGKDTAAAAPTPRRQVPPSGRRNSASVPPP